MTAPQETVAAAPPFKLNQFVKAVPLVAELQSIILLLAASVITGAAKVETVIVVGSVVPGNAGSSESTIPTAPSNQLNLDC